MSETTSIHPAISWAEWSAMVGVSLLAALAVWFHWVALDPTEVLGFVTGGVCVWLTARAHVWNFPVGLANNVFFFVLFLRAALYADVSLQVIYFGLGVYGWRQWAHGGRGGEPLTISRTRPGEWLALLAAVALGTYAMREMLVRAHGASPLWDGLTTALSLAAQFLLSRKRLEHWLLWILADLIYIPLYFTKSLPLTAVLYAVFLLMCIFGFQKWRATWKSGEPRAGES